MKPSQVPGFVCGVLGVDEEKALSRSKKRPHVDARFIIIGLWASKWDMKSWEIGERLGLTRDAVTHALSRGAVLFKYDNGFRGKLLRVREAWNADPC